MCGLTRVRLTRAWTGRSFRSVPEGMLAMPQQTIRACVSVYAFLSICCPRDPLRFIRDDKQAGSLLGVELFLRTDHLCVLRLCVRASINSE